MKFLFLFCTDSSLDPVAPAVYQQALIHYKATPSTFMVSGKSVFWAEVKGNQLYFAETKRFASESYRDIAIQLNSQFSGVDMIGLVNWHAGTNAPAKIFCAHSTADVPSGIFGPTSGKLLAATLMAIEEERRLAGLDDFRTLFEASHWSGLTYGREAPELKTVMAPVFDIEIGSFADDFANPIAQTVLVRALGRISDFCHTNKLRALYFGGIHFEPSATEIVFRNEVVLEHQLPNHWLVSGGYNLLGAEEKLIAAAKSCLNAPELFVYNDGLKAPYKENVRKAAENLRIPCVSHKKLRAPDFRQIVFGEPV